MKLALASCPAYDPSLMHRTITMGQRSVRLSIPDERLAVLTHADVSLAARLEGLCAAEMSRFVESARAIDPQSDAVSVEIGGGVAAFIAPGSPVNQAFGMGFGGKVGADDVAEIERFYHERGARPLMGVSPLADRSLHESLVQRKWAVDGFENVMYLDYSAGADLLEVSSDIDIREVTDGEARNLWVLAAATGFSAPLPPLDEQLDLGRIVVRRPGTRLFLAYVDGKIAGTGELFVDDGVAWLSADSTLPQFRRRGVQRALQAFRLRLGADAGCQLAASEASPGSGSQRNMERAGLRVAYTRVDFLGQSAENCPDAR